MVNWRNGKDTDIDRYRPAVRARLPWAHFDDRPTAQEQE